MVNGLVIITQAGLAALVLLMAFRVLTLVRSDPLTESMNTHHPDREPARRSIPPSRPREAELDRTELFTRLHILAGLQERDCKVNGLELCEAPEVVRCYAVAWLYGAACALCDPASRHSERLAGLVAHIASRKFGIRQPFAVQTISTLTRNTVLMACFRGGLEGAEFWLQHRYVSPGQSLYRAITNNAFI